MFIYDELKSLEIQNKSIKVGLVGAGFMGQGIVEVMESTPGMVVAAISDINIERAAVSFQAVNFKNFKEIKSAGEARSINFSEERVISSNYRVIPEIDCLDFIIEATGVPEIGAEVAYSSIMNGKHIGMLNVETDVTIGYYLNTLAKKTGTVYTVCTGDEPAAIKEIYDFVKTFGFKVVVCGKGKNNPLEVSATPLTLEKKAENSGLNPRMLTEFVDGSKTMVEMSCVANATGLTIDRRNMHGPRTQVDKLAEVFTLKERGGILMNEGVVDYAIGDIAPGVFVVAKHEGALVNKTLILKKEKILTI
jgi:predicted homoserine dehydrogenase-like protein